MLKKPDTCRNLESHNKKSPAKIHTILLRSEGAIFFLDEAQGRDAVKRKRGIKRKACHREKF